MRYFMPCAFALTLFCAHASADVIERDWKELGDGLLTYDDVNRREWLDLSETLLFQFSGDINDRVTEVLAETNSGGIFEGFSGATETDVMTLAESAGVDNGTTELITNQSAASNLIDLLEETLSIGSSGKSSRGFLKDFPYAAWITVNNQAGYFDGVPNQDPSILLNHTGVWLFREVPEPTSTLLVMQFAILLSKVRYSRPRRS
jgi:hypothetical protein